MVVKIRKWISISMKWSSSPFLWINADTGRDRSTAVLLWWIAAAAAAKLSACLCLLQDFMITFPLFNTLRPVTYMYESNKPTLYLLPCYAKSHNYTVVLSYFQPCPYRSLYKIKLPYFTVTSIGKSSTLQAQQITNIQKFVLPYVVE